MSAPVTGPDGGGGPTGSQAPTPAPAPGSQPYTNDQIKGYVTDQGWVDSTGAVTNPYAVYGEAVKYGVNEDQLDQAMGWESGTSANWIKSQGYNPLTAAAPPPAAPAPAPAPTPTSQPPEPAPSVTTQQAASSLMGVGSQDYMAQGQGAVNSAQSAAANVPTSSYQQGTSTQGQAAQTQWDESMSAAGRLNSMLDQNGALMQSAALRGKQQAARMGLGQSTMAAEAMQKAMIDSATPFATTDAQLYNQMQMANTSEANKWDTLDLDRMQNDRQYASQMGLEYDKLEQNAQQFADKMGLDWAGMQQAERMEVMKLAQQESQFTRAQGQDLTIAGMNFDIQDRRLSQEDRQFMQTMGMERDKLNTQISQFEKSIGMDRDKMSQQDKQYYDGLLLERDKLDQQADQFAKDWENKFSFETLAQENRIDLTKLDGDTKKDIAGIEAQYRTDIAGNENISQAWGLMVSEIGKINANPELSEAAKKTNISNALAQFSSFTNFWKKTSGGDMDVSDLLNFGMLPATTDPGAGADPVPTNGSLPGFNESTGGE